MNIVTTGAKGGTQIMYEFAGFLLDLGRRTLLRNGEPVPLTPKVLETLIILVLNAGRVLKKEELMQAVWPDSVVEEGNLSQNVFLLRKTLGDDQNGLSFIQTIPRRGYKFVAPVTQLDTLLAADAPQPLVKSFGPADYWRHHSPFRGLQVFEPDDAWLFIGRQDETQELLHRLERSPVLALVGNSGSGKSSLVRAGLIPAVRGGALRPQTGPVSFWRTALFRPSSAPFDYLAETLPHQLAPALGLKEQAEFIADCKTKLPDHKESLRNAISALASWQMDDISPGQSGILLVVDQFEELFTLGSSQEIREKYIDSLLSACGTHGAVYVFLVIVLRADFYAQCLDHEGLSRCLESSLYNLPRMSGEKLRESIETRLKLARASAEAGLIDALLDDVGLEPGNLALLEHALGQLWERCSSADRVLTNQAYSRIGRLRGALGRHADEIYESLDDEKQRRLAQRVFLELVHLGEGAQDTRRRLKKSDLLSLASAEDLESLLTRLVASRLLSVGTEGAETFVEVSHEALIREWPALRDWLTQNREEIRLERRLRVSAEEWQALVRDAGALLQGARLAQAEEWRAKHPEAPAFLKEFIVASVAARLEAQTRALAQQRELRSQAEARAEAERQLRQEQTSAASRLRQWSLALGVALVLALGAVGLAFQQKRIAYQQKRIAESQALAAKSTSLSTTDPGQAAALAESSLDIAETDEARRAVARASAQRVDVGYENNLVRIQFSPDGAYIISISERCGKIWDVGKLTNAAQLPGVPLQTPPEIVLAHSCDLPPNTKFEDAAISPNGDLVAAVASDRTLHLWKMADGTIVPIQGAATSETMNFDDQPRGRLSWSPDGQLIITSGWDEPPEVRSAEDGHIVAALKGQDGIVNYAAFSPDGKHIVTARRDRKVGIWTADGRLQFSLEHGGVVLHAEFSPDGRKIITTSADRTARIWNADNGSLITAVSHDGSVTDGHIAPDGKRFITASDDHSAVIWGIDGRKLFTLEHEGPVKSAQFSRDGRQVVTSSYRTGEIWNAANGRLLISMEINEAGQASFSPDGHYVLTGINNGYPELWTAANVTTAAILGGHRALVKHAEFSPDGKYVLTTSPSNPVRLWSISDYKRFWILQGTGGSFAHFSPDGGLIVAPGSGNSGAQIWQVSTRKLIATLPGSGFWNAEFSPDGGRIATAGKDGNTQIWSTDGKLLLTLTGHKAEIYHVHFSQNGTEIVTASKDRTARIWDSSTGKNIAILSHDDIVWDAAFSPDGSRVATASRDRTARIWSARNGTAIALLKHSEFVDTVQFSPDGQKVVTAGWDGIARVWSADGSMLSALDGHSRQLYTASFSKDGRFIVTGSSGYRAKVWSASNYTLVATLCCHAGSIYDAAFSSDSRLIVTASTDQTARIWRMPTFGDLETMPAK